MDYRCVVFAFALLIVGCGKKDSGGPEGSASAAAAPGASGEHRGGEHRRHEHEGEKQGNPAPSAQ